MIGVLGDLLTDVVVHLRAENIRHGTDTPSYVEHRRGGSAANLAVAAARLDAGAGMGAGAGAGAGAKIVKFIGNVGDDKRGDELLAELEAEGVKCAVTRGGQTGTVVALLDENGERTMLTDRGASKDFQNWEQELGQNVLDDIQLLHIPGYSLIVEPLGTSAMQMISALRAKNKRANNKRSNNKQISIGISSVGAIEDFGVEKFWELLEKVDPDYIICNQTEAEFLGEKLLEKTCVVTNGAHDTFIYAPANISSTPATTPEKMQKITPPPLKKVADTTGAGDAFAAGLLVALADGKPLPAAVEMGHKSAYDLLASRET